MLENFTLFSGITFNIEFWSSTASVCLYASASTRILTLINQVTWCHPVLKQRHQIQLELHTLHDSDIVTRSSFLLSFPDFVLTKQISIEVPHLRWEIAVVLWKRLVVWGRCKVWTWAELGFFLSSSFIKSHLLGCFPTWFSCILAEEQNHNFLNTRSCWKVWLSTQNIRQNTFDKVEHFFQCS